MNSVEWVKGYITQPTCSDNQNAPGNGVAGDEVLCFELGQEKKRIKQSM